MDPAARFVELVSHPAGDAPVERLAALLGAAFDRGVDPGQAEAELDALAATCPASFDGIMAALFRGGRFAGNTAHYDDPRNSYLHEVLRRGVGLPITLSVVAIAVGRRLGVVVDGIGLPGHFVVGDGSGERFADPFHGGEVHDSVSLSLAWQRITGSPTPASRSMLAPSPARAIVLRMLNNLGRVLAAADDHVALHTLARLRGAFPELAHEAAERARWVRHFN